jgi:hypothetical protein
MTDTIFASFLAVICTLIATRSMTTAHPNQTTIDRLYPDIADTSHATSAAADFFRGYFSAKSIHNACLWLQFFHPTQVVYYDAILGWGFPNRSSLETSFTPLVEAWPKNVVSYPLRILGDTTTAVVHYVDTPELFGAEIRAISAIDFKDGLVTRQVDDWDGRLNPVIADRPPEAQYPYDLGVMTVNETADPEMRAVALQLKAAFASGNVSAAAALFTYDAIFEDVTLRTRLEGKLAIGQYLRRALFRLPYGPGVVVRHVLGSSQGRGFKWQTRNPVLNGITALELDYDGLITRLTTSWDGSPISDPEIQVLAGLSIEG